VDRSYVEELSKRCTQAASKIRADVEQVEIEFGMSQATWKELAVISATRIKNDHMLDAIDGADNEALEFLIKLKPPRDDAQPGIFDGNVEMWRRVAAMFDSVTKKYGKDAVNYLPPPFPE
jgi:hypothetical protein